MTMDAGLLAPGRPEPVARSAPTPLVALLLGVAVTAIALPESWSGWPYAPFPILHLTLAIVLPVLYRALPSGRPGPELRRLLPAQVAPFAVAIVFVVSFIVGYTVLLAATDRAGDPSWDLIAAYRELLASCVERYGMGTTVVLAYLLLGVWPMFGEELFYRGLVLRGLLGGVSRAIAVTVSSLLFGLRHAAQLVYFVPEYPVVAGIAYFVWAFGISVILGWVYLRTRSLWVCMAFHSVNVVLAPFVIALLLA